MPEEFTHRERFLNTVANKLVQYLHGVIEKYFVCVSREISCIDLFTSKYVIYSRM